MSIRVDSSPLIAGAVVVGDLGHGALAELIPSAGEAGPGYAYSSLEFPADNGKEIRGLITSWPTNGTLSAYEDTSFTYDGTSDTFAWQLYVDGVAVGTPQTVTLTVGGTVSNLALDDAQHAHSAGNAELSSAHTLVASNAAHSHAATAADISATLSLLLDSAAHAHAAGTPELTVPASGGTITLAADNFNGASAGQELSAYNPSWVKHPSYSLNAVVNTDGRVEAQTSESTSGTAYYYNVPAHTADYSVSTDFVSPGAATTAGPYTSINGRMSASANTMYRAGYSCASGQWQLYRSVGGGLTLLDAVTQAFGTGVTRNVRLEMVGSTIKLYVDGAVVIDYTDATPITAAGYGGLRVIGRTTPAQVQIDNFTVTYEAGATSDLTTEGATHAHSADDLTLSAALALAVSSSAHSHSAGAVALAATLNLLVSNALHAHSAQALTLDSTAAANLATANAAHAHTVDAPSLSAAMSLLTASAHHAHSAQTPVLFANHSLTTSNAAHAHTADVVGAATGLAMAVQSAFHAHIADGVALDTAMSLAVHDALHTHAADAATLSTLVNLIVEDALHAHAAQNATLYLPVAAAELLRRSVFARLLAQTTFVRTDTTETFARTTTGSKFTRLQ